IAPGAANNLGTSGLRLLDAGGIEIAGVAASSNLNQALVAYYPLDGNANDASGKGRNGINKGATPTPGKFGAAKADVAFNGSNSYIQVTSQLSTNNPFTWSAWFRPNFSTTNVMGSIMNQGNSPGSNSGVSPGIWIDPTSAFTAVPTALPGAIDFFAFQ